jgi:hypothetical protein
LARIDPIERGKFLTWLILFMGAAITLASLACILGQSRIEAVGFGPFPNWFGLFVFVLLVGRLIALFAIWNFKRWGVYLFFLLECTEVAMGVFVFSPAMAFPLRLMMAMPMFLAVVVVWLLALRSRWYAFR